MRIFSDMRRVLGDLTGRGQHTIVGILLAHVRVTRKAVEVARAATAGRIASAEASVRIDELEAEGDQRRGELVRELAGTLVIPIDREDLFRLSRSIDDVLDDLRDFSRELELFGPSVATELFDPVFAAIEHTLEEFDHAIEELARDPDAAMPKGLAAKRSGKEIRRTYQDAMAQLLDQELASVTLKRRELLRRLDTVGISISEATDALADGGLKRGR